MTERDSLIPTRPAAHGALADGGDVRLISPHPRHAEDVLQSLAQPIAVVGNATPSHFWGTVIDRYATIIRLNNFRIEGFESLVGQRTDVRCTSAWYDVEHRSAHVEISPFTSSARESENLEAFSARNHRPVLPAHLDVRPLISEVPNPSTGLTLVQLLQAIGVPADLFCFDGFRSAHYWRPDRHVTSHSGSELGALLTRETMAVYTESTDYVARFADERDRMGEVADAGYRAMMARPGGGWIGKRVLQVGAASERVAPALARQGHRVITIPVGRGDGEAGMAGGVLPLAFLDETFDCCVSLGLLDELHPNDARIFLRQAARLAPRLFVTLRNCDALPVNERDVRGPAPLEWWMTQCAAYYDLAIEPGSPEGYFAVLGTRRDGATAGRLDDRHH